MNFRKATKKDVPEIVKMLADDELGKIREDYKIPLPDVYYQAFENINQDSNQELMVVETGEKEIIGTLQLTFIQDLSHQGGLRAQIEAVRINKNQRGKGIGKKMFEWAIQQAKNRGAYLMQLTTNRQRPEAIEFYKSLNFNPSHVGMKMYF